MNHGKRRICSLGLLALMALCLRAGATTASAQGPQPIGPPFYPPVCDAGMALSEGSWTYRAGWSLVASPDGTAPAGAIGPLYSLNTVSGDYDAMAQGNAIEPGTGYWAFFDRDSRAMFGPLGSSHVPITEQLPPGQWVLVGNPYPRTANLDGPDSFYYYIPSQGYVTGNGYLGPGEAVWAYSAAGGTGTFTNISRCSG